MAKKQIPNKQGAKVKKGDLVHVTIEEGVIVVGEVVGFVYGFKNWIKDVKTKGKDGYTLLEVKNMSVELVQIIGTITKSTFFQKVSAWFKKVFKKKNK